MAAGVASLIFLGVAPSPAFSPTGDNTWPLGIEPDFQLPSNAQITDEIVALGKHLFFDKRLSRDHSISCASCHNPEQSFSNGVPVAEGVGGQRGNRNVPTILNRLFSEAQFWDGRATSLEEQALGPMMASVEMGMSEELVMERLNVDPEYQRLFHAAFGTKPSLEGVALAIAAFERTVMTGASPFDRYEWDGDEEALSPAAIRGLNLFRGKANCNTCHVGTNFSDEKYHNLGVDTEVGRIEQGRMAVTKDKQDRGGFKTPTLRNIADTAPYMHDGSIATLAEVIDFYNRGCAPNPNLDEDIKPLNLTETEKADLLAFLESLSGPIVYVSAEEIRDYAP